jgi:hypothetical protein
MHLDASFLQQPMLHGRVCLTAAFAASGLTRTCSKADFDACLYLLYSSLCYLCMGLGASILWQPVLPLNVSLLQQSVLSLDVTVCLFYCSLYCPRSCLACSCMLVLQMHVFVQQQPMLCQEVYGKQQFVLHLYCLSAGASAAPGRVYLHGPLCCTWTCLSTRALCCTWMRLPTRALCCTCACLSTRALCCTWMRLPKSALFYTWTCLSARTFAARVRVCLQL